MSSPEKQQRDVDSKYPIETEPFLEGESRAQFTPDNEPPKDKCKIVLFVMMLHGLGILIAWNVFITIASDYYIKYKFKSDDKEDPSYVSNFMNYVCICSQLPNLLINLVSLFSGSGNLVLRIVFSLIIVAASCVFTIVFIYIDTTAWKFNFFIITMVSVVILNTANGFYQNSVYGLVGSFPFEYINAVVLGNNICGLLVTILYASLAYATNDIQIRAAVYFSIALFLLIICIVSFLYVRKNPYFAHQMTVAKRAAEAHGTFTLADYMGVIRDYWLPLIDVFCVFFVTLMLFPAVFTDINLYPLGRKYDLFIPEELFLTISVFLNFNTFTVIGSKLADYIRWPSPKYAWIPIFTRLLFIPIFLACNYAPGKKRNLPVYIPNEWAVFVLISLMSITHGYYSSISLMYAPHGADANKARIIGKMAAFFLVFGIASGIGCSFLANAMFRP